MSLELSKKYTEWAEKELRRYVAPNTDPFLFFIALHNIYTFLEQKKFFVTKMYVNFNPQFEIKLTGCKKKPKDWVYDGAMSYLIAVHTALSSATNVIIHDFTIEYDKPVEIHIGELLNARQYPFDMKKVTGVVQDAGRFI